MVTDDQLSAAIAAAPFIHARLGVAVVKAAVEIAPAEEQRRHEARQSLLHMLEGMAEPVPLLQGTPGE
ncbi:MAG: hypothetical protein JO264_13840 [Acidisphaera sp.]|nr:hypothetical protein [Acidisphaera sp.]